MHALKGHVYLLTPILVEEFIIWLTTMSGGFPFYNLMGVAGALRAHKPERRLSKAQHARIWLLPVRPRLKPT